MQCISLSQQLPEMRKQGLTEGEGSGEGPKPGKWLSWNSKPDALILKLSQVPSMSRGASAVHIRVEGSQGHLAPCCSPQWIRPTPEHCCSKSYLILGRRDLSDSIPGGVTQRRMLPGPPPNSCPNISLGDPRTWGLGSPLYR